MHDLQAKYFQGNKHTLHYVNLEVIIPESYLIFVLDASSCHSEKENRWDKWNDTNREIYEMFRTIDTDSKRYKKCHRCWYVILSIMRGSTTIIPFD